MLNQPAIYRVRHPYCSKLCPTETLFSLAYTLSGEPAVFIMRFEQQENHLHCLGGSDVSLLHLVMEIDSLKQHVETETKDHSFCEPDSFVME